MDSRPHRSVAGGIVVFAGGFVLLYRLLAQSESSMAGLAQVGFTVAIVTASTLAILQAVDGIALKRAVDSWTAAPAEEKTITFRVAEGIRWTEISINSIFRILQGSVAVIFGVAIATSTFLVDGLEELECLQVLPPLSLA
jgi:hypothetical protein